MNRTRLFLLAFIISTASFTANSIYSTTAKVTVTADLTNICQLSLPKSYVNFGRLTKENLIQNNNITTIIPINITCQGGFNQQSLTLSFIPQASDGHNGLPTSGILNTSLANVGIQLATDDNHYSQTLINGVNAKNHQPLTFYAPYHFNVSNRMDLNITAKPIVINHRDPITAGHFQSGLNIVMNYN